jgi:hypothetical protein
MDANSKQPRLRRVKFCIFHDLRSDFYLKNRFEHNSELVRLFDYSLL